MNVLLAFITAVILELIKILSKKFGVEMSKKIVYGILFALVAGWVYLSRTGILSKESVTIFLQILTEAVGLYHLIVKPLRGEKTEINIQ